MNIALASVVLLLQVSQTAVSNAPTKPASGSIEGIVRRVGTGEAIFKARVLLRPLPPLPPKSVTTDKYGRFIFSGLDAGTYSLTAFANSYVRQAYGQKAQSLPGTPIVLTARQEKKDLLFEMTPTGTVTGRIYDFDNMPMPGADVTLQRLAYDANGQKSMHMVHQVRTNDLGEYRLFWVTPGKYFVRVDYTAVPMQFSRYPNEYIGPLGDGYVPTFYPGTAEVSAASEIELSPGAEMSAIDITMVRTKTFKVTGRVIVTADVPTGTRPSISMHPKESGGFFTNSTLNPDGTFEIRNVTPGTHILSANTGNGLTGWRAEKWIDVNGDVEGVEITISSGFSVPIRVVFEGQKSTTGPDGEAVGNMRAMLRSMEEGRSSGSSAIRMFDPPTMKPDGAITISNVLPGTYQLSLVPLPSVDHYIKAVTLGRTDALRDGITVDRTPDSPVEVLIGSNAGRIEGSILDREGKPVSSTQVILIPSDRTRMERFKAATADTNGHFTLRGIYPGEYKLFAWDGLEPGAYRDPEVVRRYEEQGLRVPIGEGSNADVELRVIRVP